MKKRFNCIRLRFHCYRKRRMLDFLRIFSHFPKLTPITKLLTMKNPKNTPVEDVEVRLENLNPEEMKQIVSHFASLLRSRTLEEPSQADESRTTDEN